MITEQFMSYGSFTVQLEGLTTELLDRDWQWATIAFVPNRVGEGTRTNVLDAAVYSGRVDEWDPGEPGAPATVGGRSILEHAGDGDGKGAFLNGGADQPAPIATTLGATLSTGAVFGTPAYVGGLTLGNTTGLSANNINDEIKGAPTGPGETLMTALKRWLPLTTVQTEFRLRPNGVMDFSKFGTSNVFRTTPNVIIGRDVPQGKAGSYRVYSATTLRRKLDHSRAAIRVGAFNSDLTYSTEQYYGNFSATAYTNFDGATAITLTKYLANSNTNSVQDPAHADTDARVASGQYDYQTFSSWTVSVDAYCFADDAKPGDYLYIHDPHIGAVDKFNAVPALGTIFPETVRLTGMTYPVPEGWSVWVLFNDDTGDVENLTDFFVRESGPTRLEIDARPVTLTDVTRGTSR